MAPHTCKFRCYRPPRGKPAERRIDDVNGSFQAVCYRFGSGELQGDRHSVNQEYRAGIPD